MSGARALTALLMILAGRSAEASESPLARDRMLDGSELIHVHISGARTTALRVVVRSGSADEAPDRRGVARLVARAVLEGSYETSRRQLTSIFRKAGATVDATTTPNHTVFALDAPSPAFVEVARVLVAVLTNAAMTLSVHGPKTPVSEEPTLWPSLDPSPLLDRLIFPSHETDAAQPSPDRPINVEGLIDFYAEHYIPANLTFIVVGDLGHEETRNLIEETSRLPPSLPSEKIREDLSEPKLPIAIELAGPTHARIFGYALDDAHHGACRGLAALLELRLILALEVETALAASVEMACLPLRKQLLLLATVPMRSEEPSGLVRTLRSTFGSISKKPVTREERASIEQHFEHAVERDSAAPERLADRLVLAVDPTRVSKKRRLARLLEAPSLDKKALARAAEESFQRAREISVRLSPAPP